VQELETAGKRINEFIAMLAHELRNPLAPISNAVRILEKTDTSPEVARNTQLIARQVGHLSRRVDDLLDVSRITSGKIKAPAARAAAPRRYARHRRHRLRPGGRPAHRARSPGFDFHLVKPVEFDE
jgi:signal transduction histidine kinase